ncbi:MAG: hypothetical protein IT366_18990 [Candidatus Hydrogenedentes bacterium]|nr:hypothetical protein [Candidatus Hydrogenedentota bacterium]
MIHRGAGLRFVSGSWTALAVDVSHGILYRPVVGPMGYGGTRYMPLHFSLHGGLIALTNNAIASGAIVTLLSAIALLSGVYVLLRAYGVPRKWAACGITLALASIASQLAIVTIRGDLLPAALNVWGLALFARRRNDQTVSVLFPTLLFSLAFAAKITTLFGLAACIVYLALQKKYRDGLRMILAAAVGMIAVLVAAYFASGGRIIESMRVCGSGGAGLVDILTAPFKFALFACLDLGFLPFFVATAIVLAARVSELFRELHAHAVLWTLAVTIFIFGSPGIDFNHLLDLHVACVALLTIHMAQGTRPHLATRICAAGGLLASTAIFAVCAIAVRAFPVALHDDRLAAYNAAHDGSGPVLSEDPWVPVMGGETPFLLDPFNLRLACAKDERVQKDLWNRIASHYFSGVVLTPIEDRASGQFDLHGAWLGTTHYGGLHFPPGFIEHLYTHYEPAAHIRCYLVLRPKREITASGL